MDLAKIVSEYKACACFCGIKQGRQAAEFSQRRVQLHPVRQTKWIGLVSVKFCVSVSGNVCAFFWGEGGARARARVCVCAYVCDCVCVYVRA